MLLCVFIFYFFFYFFFYSSINIRLKCVCPVVIGTRSKKAKAIIPRKDNLQSLINLNEEDESISMENFFRENWLDKIVDMVPTATWMKLKAVLELNGLSVDGDAMARVTVKQIVKELFGKIVISMSDLPSPKIRHCVKNIRKALDENYVEENEYVRENEDNNNNKSSINTDNNNNNSINKEKGVIFPTINVKALEEKGKANKPLADLTVEEVANLFAVIDFLDCKDIIFKHRINGYMLNLADFDDIKEFNFPLMKVQMKSLMARLEEFRREGVPMAMLNQQSTVPVFPPI